MDDRDSEAPTCGGCSYFTGPICCGKTVNGECRVVCCIQEQVPCDGCEDCQPSRKERP